jgi:hypothetical protein
LFTRPQIHKPGSGSGGTRYQQKPEKYNQARPFQAHVSTPFIIQNTIKFCFTKIQLRFNVDFAPDGILYQAFSKIGQLQQQGSFFRWKAAENKKAAHFGSAFQIAVNN